MSVHRKDQDMRKGQDIRTNSYSAHSCYSMLQMARAGLYDSKSGIKPTLITCDSHSKHEKTKITSTSPEGCLTFNYGRKLFNVMINLIIINLNKCHLRQGLEVI